MTACAGRLAYRVLGGMRVLGTDETGLLVYEWRCEACGKGGTSRTGTERLHSEANR